MAKRLTEAQLIERLDAAKKQVTIGALYKHYKGDTYKIIDLAILTEGDDEVAVIYEAQYGHHLTFIRPLKMWSETVEYDGEQLQRFEES